MLTISIVIPAWNESKRIEATLRSLQEMRMNFPHIHWEDVLVVDDGSIDHTYETSRPWCDRLVRNDKNKGKGPSMEIGWREVKRSEIIMFLDADLGSSAQHAVRLLYPILNDEADMTIARLPTATVKGGFGLARGLARSGIRHLCGFDAQAPLSGQRAMRTAVLQDTTPLSQGFGVEVGLTIDTVRKGYRVQEVDVPFTHRETARDWQGFLHRGRQFFAIGRTLMHKWKQGTR